MSIKKNTASNPVTQLTDFLHAYDRGDGISINNKPSYTVEEAADAITRSGRYWQDNNQNNEFDFTFSFLNDRTASYDQEHLSGFSEFNELQKSEVLLSLQSWSDVATISFHEGSSGGDAHINFGNYTADPLHGGRGALAFFPNSSGTSDALFLANNSYTINSNPSNGNFGRSTLTHEIGHTLGLEHPGNYDASAQQAPSYDNAQYLQDTLGYSVMSYWSESNTNQNFTKNNIQAFTAAPLIDDIAAIQKLYGANYNTRSDDTIYGFNSNTNRDFLSATTNADKLIFSIWDGGGNDTLDFSGFTQNQKINLNETSLSDVGGLVGNVSIAKGVTVENAIGGSGSDLIVGNSLTNIIKGGAGNDLIYGGGGEDQLWGGAGDDIFVYGASSDSKQGAADKIFDFSSGSDKIDLTGITNGAGLSFVNAFTGNAGDAVLSYASGTNLGTLAVDFSGHGVADFLVTTVGQAIISDVIA